MVNENLLQKVRRSLSHLDIGLFRSRERDSYTQNIADYGYRFEVFPKKGVYKINYETRASLIDLCNRVFGELLSEEYQDRNIEFEGVPNVSWGVIPPYDNLEGQSDIFLSPGLRIFEPVGIREERNDAYTVHSRFYLLPQFTSEFSPEEGGGENHIPHKETISRKPITRLIDVALFPSLEYLKELSEIHRERDAIFALNLGLDPDSMKDYDEIKNLEREIGFVDIDSILISAYNSFFSQKK